MSTIPAPGPLYQRRQRGTRGRRAFAVPVTQQEILLHGQRVAFLEAGADYGGPVVMFHDLLPGSRLEIFDGAGHFHMPSSRADDLLAHFLISTSASLGPAVAATPIARRSLPRP